MLRALAAAVALVGCSLGRSEDEGAGSAVEETNDPFAKLAAVKIGPLRDRAFHLLDGALVDGKIDGLPSKMADWAKCDQEERSFVYDEATSSFHATRLGGAWTGIGISPGRKWAAAAGLLGKSGSECQSADAWQLYSAAIDSSDAPVPIAGPAKNIVWGFVGETIYVVSAGAVRGIDPASGKEAWNFSLGGEMTWDSAAFKDYPGHAASADRSRVVFYTTREAKLVDAKGTVTEIDGYPAMAATTSSSHGVGFTASGELRFVRCRQATGACSHYRALPSGKIELLADNADSYSKTSADGALFLSQAARPGFSGCITGTALTPTANATVIRLSDGNKVGLRGLDWGSYRFSADGQSVFGSGRLARQVCGERDRYGCGFWASSTSEGPFQSVIPQPLSFSVPHQEGANAYSTGVCDEAPGAQGYFFTAETADGTLRAFFRARGAGAARDLGVPAPSWSSGREGPTQLLQTTDGPRQSAVVRDQSNKAWLVSLTHEQKCVRLPDVNWRDAQARWKDGILYYQGADYRLRAATIDGRFTATLADYGYVLQGDVLYKVEQQGNQPVLYRMALPAYDPPAAQALAEGAVVDDCKEEAAPPPPPPPDPYDGDGGADVQAPPPPPPMDGGPDAETGELTDAGTTPPTPGPPGPTGPERKRPVDDAGSSAAVSSTGKIEVDACACTAGPHRGRSPWVAALGLLFLAYRRRRPIAR
jgi:hypothetical protein